MDSTTPCIKEIIILKTIKRFQKNLFFKYKNNPYKGLFFVIQKNL